MAQTAGDFLVERTLAPGLLNIILEASHESSYATGQVYGAVGGCGRP
jgi:hypothetical protein